MVSKVKLMLESYISAGSVVGRCLGEYEVVCEEERSGLEPRLGEKTIRPMKGDFVRQ